VGWRESFWGWGACDWVLAFSTLQYILRGVGCSVSMAAYRQQGFGFNGSVSGLLMCAMCYVSVRSKLQA